MAVTIEGAEVVSLSVPRQVVEKIDLIAAERHVNRDRAIADLLQDAFAAYEQRKVAFIELVQRFQESTDPAEAEHLRQELALMTFGG